MQFLETQSKEPGTIEHTLPVRNKHVMLDAPQSLTRNPLRGVNRTAKLAPVNDRRPPKDIHANPTIDRSFRSIRLQLRLPLPWFS